MPNPHILSYSDTFEDVGDEALIYRNVFSNLNVKIIISKNRTRAIELAKALSLKTRST